MKGVGRSQESLLPVNSSDMALWSGISTLVPEGGQRMGWIRSRRGLQSLSSNKGKSNTFFVSFRGRIASRIQSVTIAEMKSRTRRRQQGVCEEKTAVPDLAPGILPQPPRSTSSEPKCALQLLRRSRSRLRKWPQWRPRLGRPGGGGPRRPLARSLARSLGKARRSRHRSRAEATLSGRPRPPRRLPPGSSPDAHGPRPPGLSWQQLHH